MGLLSSPAWTRKEGKNPKGGLNAKGRASYNKGRTKTGKKRNLKPPAPNPKTKKDKGRRKSFLVFGVCNFPFTLVLIWNIM